MVPSCSLSLSLSLFLSLCICMYIHIYSSRGRMGPSVFNKTITKHCKNHMNPYVVFPSKVVNFSEAICNPPMFFAWRLDATTFILETTHATSPDIQRLHTYTQSYRHSNIHVHISNNPAVQDIQEYMQHVHACIEPFIHTYRHTYMHAYIRRT